jgi:hypothetical protein
MSSTASGSLRMRGETTDRRIRHSQMTNAIRRPRGLLVEERRRSDDGNNNGDDPAMPPAVVLVEEVPDGKWCWASTRRLSIARAGEATPVQRAAVEVLPMTAAAWSWRIGMGALR